MVEDWPSKLRSLRDDLEKVRTDIDVLDRIIMDSVVGYDVLPRRMPDEFSDPLQRINKVICDLDRKVARLHETMVQNPIYKKLTGQDMTDAEEHLMMSMMPPDTKGEDEV